MPSQVLLLSPVDRVAHRRPSRVLAAAVLVVALLELRSGLPHGDPLRHLWGPVTGASAPDVDYGALPLAFAPIGRDGRAFAAGLPSVHASVSATGAVLALGPAGDTSLRLRMVGATPPPVHPPSIVCPES